jgi:hypothetical protein
MAVLAARPPRPEPDVRTLVVGVETKAILLVDRLGTRTTSIAPAIRVGYIATAITVDIRGTIDAVLTAPMTLDPTSASSHLADLATAHTAVRGPLHAVGLIGDERATEIVRGALRQLHLAGECDGWIEVLDPCQLRSRLHRMMEVLEPSARVRDAMLSAWDVALAFEPGAIDEVIAELNRRADGLVGADIAAVESLIIYLRRHRIRADYGTLRARGIEIPVASPSRSEFLPLRMSRARCRPSTVEL